MRLIILLLLLTFTSETSIAQSFQVKGKLKDKETKQALPGAVVSINPKTDSLEIVSGISGDDGEFSIALSSAGDYVLNIRMLGFQSVTKSIRVDQPIVDIGDIIVGSSSHSLKGVEVEAVQSRVEQKGDTAQFNAGSYKVNADASAEDLVTKLPGVVNDNGTLKINGEDIKRITVDGKPFFGDDPMAALKNLPAEVIDKIQSFDRLSDQAQFTGFDDGQGARSLNIVTKPGKNTGQFGKVYAGYGTDDRYSAGGSLNFFDKKSRITVVGMSNNINQQNFSSSDMQTLTGNTGQGPPGMGGPGGGGVRGHGGGRPGMENPFMSSEQGGIVKTNSLGINLSTQFSPKVKLSGSYFLNQTDNNSITKTTRTYVSASDSGLIYEQLSTSGKLNLNHKTNLKVEIEIDSANSILITPRVNLSSSMNEAVINGGTLNNERVFISKVFNDNITDARLTSFSNSFLYKHNFNKKGRTLSLNFTNDLSNRLTTSDQQTINSYFYPSFDSVGFQQHYDQAVVVSTISPGMVLTESISSKGQLQLSYQPSFTRSSSDKETEIKTSGSTDFILDSLLSNQFDNSFTTHVTKLNYKWSKDQSLNIMAGIGHQYSELRGLQQFPSTVSTFRVFRNVVPEAMMNYKFNPTTNLRIRYRTNINPPSVSQLQNVVDNSNPLLLKSGNPLLQQELSHMVFSRFGKTNPVNGRALFLFLHGSVTDNYIGNATFIANRDTVINNIFLRKGSQLTIPVNVNGMASARAFITYSFPVKYIRSNVHLSGSGSLSKLPGLINDQKNLSTSYGLNQGLAITSNVSEKLDFTLSYNATYTIANNSLQPGMDNNFFQQTSSIKLNWIPVSDFVINSSASHLVISGLSSGYNRSFILWNGGIGYKLLKSKLLEARLSVFDILNQNTGVSRNITETYIEDVSTNILNRYFMVTITYNIRKFKSGEVKKEKHE